MTTVRVRSKHPPVVHFPALSWIDRTAVSDTDTAWSKATAMLPAFFDSEVRDCFQSQSNWADKHGTRQVIDSNAGIKAAKLRFLDRQLCCFEIKKSPDLVIAHRR